MLTSSTPFESRSAKPAPRPGEDFRLAMRELASGVCLVTHGEGDSRTGLTATSVSSLSADPPTLIVCVNRSASLYERLTIGDTFGVSVLGAHHSEFADRFASRTGLKGSERFREGAWARTPGGVSVLAEAIAVFECEAEDVIVRHSHAILVGRVRLAARRPSEGALLYWRGAYDRIGWSEEEIARAIGTMPAEAPSDACDSPEARRFK
jgi:flavin reductase (DIM6/NTAB) family NADH-FMN oxidoreductase RutF